MYIYKTTIYKSSTLVIGKLASNDADLVDFETNFKSKAELVNEIILAETTVVVEKSYADFKALIVEPIVWENVKYLSDGEYELNLLVEF